MQNLEYCDGSEKNMGQKTTDVVAQNPHDCMCVRVCEEAYVEAQQSLQFVSDGHRIGRFQTSFVTHRNARTTAVKIKAKNG